jgi:hypothetical protein
MRPSPSRAAVEAHERLQRAVRVVEADDDAARAVGELRAEVPQQHNLRPGLEAQLGHHLGFGRIIASEIEAPNLLVNLV